MEKRAKRMVRRIEKGLNGWRVLREGYGTGWKG